MDAAAFRDAVESEKETELDRLGSEKFLVAVTDAALDEESVLTAAANSEHAARNTFESWAEDESVDEAREVFADVAEQERRHYDRVAEHLPDGFDPADGGPLHTYLRGREDAVERAAGLVGRGLVSDRTHVQVVGFFVNEADAGLADLFRDLRTDTRESTSAGLDLLESLCEDDEDWERARMVAEYVVQVAYDDYADSLTGMGLDPKPIC